MNDADICKKSKPAAQFIFLFPLGVKNSKSGVNATVELKIAQGGSGSCGDTQKRRKFD